MAFQAGKMRLKPHGIFCCCLESSIRLLHGVTGSHEFSLSDTGKQMRHSGFSGGGGSNGTLK